MKMSRREVDSFLRSDNVRVWRYPNVERWLLCVYLGGLMLAIAGDLSLAEGAPVLGASVVLATGAFLYWLYFRPFLALSSTELLIRNIFATRRIPISHLRGLEPGWGGIRLELADGSIRRVWAIQQWNLARWLRRRSRIDEVIDEIRAEVASLPNRPEPRCH